MKTGGQAPERKRPTALSESKVNEALKSKYKRGDYVRIELMSGANQALSIWMSVDRSDDKHAIVFGTIEDKILAG